MKTNGGFTLIELLVVISIIALLSSVVMSSLGDARKKADMTRSIQDIKSLMSANELYKAKYGNYVGHEGWVQLGYAAAPDIISGGGGNYQGVPFLNNNIQPLVDEGFIAALPSFNGWPNNTNTYTSYIYKPMINYYSSTGITESFLCEGMDTAEYIFVIFSPDATDESIPKLMVKTYDSNGVLDPYLSGAFPNTYCFGV